MKVTLGELAQKPPTPAPVQPIQPAKPAPAPTGFESARSKGFKGGKFNRDQQSEIKQRILELRRQGKSFPDICAVLQAIGLGISPSYAHALHRKLVGGARAVNNPPELRLPHRLPLRPSLHRRPRLRLTHASRRNASCLKQLSQS